MWAYSIQRFLNLGFFISHLQFFTVFSSTERKPSARWENKCHYSRFQISVFENKGYISSDLTGFGLGPLILTEIAFVGRFLYILADYYYFFKLLMTFKFRVNFNFAQRIFSRRYWIRRTLKNLTLISTIA